MDSAGHPPAGLTKPAKQDLDVSGHSASKAFGSSGHDADEIPGRLPSGRYTLTRLSSLHCTDGETQALVPRLSSPAFCTSSSSSDSQPQLFITVETHTECLVCYKAPTAFDNHAHPSLDSFSFIGDKSVLEVALHLPLHCGVVHMIHKDSSKNRHVLGLVVPDPEKVPKAMRLDSSQMVPRTSAGLWLFEFQTEGALQHLLDQLQMVGVVMQGFSQQYELGQLLGVGSFAKVFCAEHKKAGFLVAAKVVRMDGAPNNGASNDASLMKEVWMLRRSCHPSVLKFIGLFSSIDPIDGKHAWIIVTEFAGGGELFARLAKKGPIPEERAAFILRQLLSALASMHEQGIVHRDIKTENVILMDIDTDEVKLVDFGLAAKESDREEMGRRCGSPGYVAPEVLRSETYGCKVDCFSIGVLLHILLVGRGPFSGSTVEQMLLRNMMCKVWRRHIAHLSQAAQDVILSLLNPNPTLRPTAAQCLQHPWFAGLARTEQTKGEDLEGKASERVMQFEMPFPSLFVEAHDFRKDYDERFTEDSRFSSKSSPAKASPVLSQDVILTSLPLLRTQTPTFAGMHETLSSLHASGTSPRTSFVAQDALMRMSERIVGRTTERTSAHFTLDVEALDVRPMAPESNARLRELAESDVRQSQELARASSSEGKAARRVSDIDSPKARWSFSTSTSPEDILNELPTHIQKEKRSCRAAGKKKYATDSSGSAAGSAMAVAWSLRRADRTQSDPDKVHPDGRSDEATCTKQRTAQVGWNLRASIYRKCASGLEGENDRTIDLPVKYPLPSTLGQKSAERVQPPPKRLARTKLYGRPGRSYTPEVEVEEPLLDNCASHGQPQYCSAPA